MLKAWDLELSLFVAGISEFKTSDDSKTKKKPYVGFL